MTTLTPVTREEMLVEPVGRCAAGARYLLWCVDPVLTGVTLWGRSTVEDFEELLAPLARPHHPNLRAQCDTVFDGSRIEAVDARAFGVFVEQTLRHGAAIAARTRRQALVRPSGLPGAMFAGFNALLDLGYEWRVFASLLEALQWLERPDARAIGDELARVVEATLHGSPLVARLRAFLRAQPGRASLAQAARALGSSVRSLQRHLGEHGVSFRGIVEDERMERACALLLDTDLKIESIAEQIGCASGEDFIKQFRRKLGTTPGAFRSRRRDGA